MWLMAKIRLMQRLARWHIWLGWLIAIPVLLWLVSGTIMALRPLDEVRGDDLIQTLPPVDMAKVIYPKVHEPLRELRLVPQADGPVWIATAEDGQRWRYSAYYGTATPPVIEEEARSIAVSGYKGKAALNTVTFFPADAAPAELRLEMPTWQAAFADGTNLYIDGMTGEIIGARTGKWRLYDLMWKLHIMDPQLSGKASNPILLFFAVAALIGASFGTVLLFRRRKARVATPAAPRDRGSV